VWLLNMGLYIFHLASLLLCSLAGC
jgi:hypothetical protein